jgi:hypothetical protein
MATRQVRILGAATALPRLRPLLAAAVALCALVAGASAAHSQVRVDGGPEAVHLEAHDAPLQEVLAALRRKFNLRFRTDDALETRKTGTFNGPLQRVAARILDGYDFAMTITPQGIDVLVLRQNQFGGQAVAAAIPAHPTSGTAAEPVMTAAEANRYERGHSR